MRTIPRIPYPGNVTDGEWAVVARYLTLIRPDAPQGRIAPSRDLQRPALDRADLASDDFDRMRKVTGYIKRHTSQRPDGDVTETPWRSSLMNWGHDPLRT